MYLSDVILMLLGIKEHCRIQFSASGKYAEESTFAVRISGDTMRGLVGRIIDECVGGSGAARPPRRGGVGTEYIQRTLDWLVKPRTGWPGRLDIREYRSPAASDLELI